MLLGSLVLLGFRHFILDGLDFLNGRHSEYLLNADAVPVDMVVSYSPPAARPVKKKHSFNIIDESEKFELQHARRKLAFSIPLSTRTRAADYTTATRIAYVNPRINASTGLARRHRQPNYTL